MKELKFKVSGQRLEGVDIPTDLIAGTKGYLHCTFSFEGTDWNNCKVVAEFEDDLAVPVINHICQVPVEASARPYFKFRLIGVNDDYLINTNKIIVKQEVM